MKKIMFWSKWAIVFIVVVFSMPAPAGSAVISQSGIAEHGSIITCGEIKLFWSAANDYYGYLYTDFGTLFGDVTPSTYWSSGYKTHDGVRHIWDVRDASKFTFTSPAYNVIFFADAADNANYGYRGLILFSQTVGGKVCYGALEPVDIYLNETDGKRYLSYNIWYDDQGASDFSSLSPTPSTLTFYATASATQDHSGVTSFYGDPGQWLLIRKVPTSQGGDGFVKFDLSEMDDNAVITDAELTIWQNSMHEGPLDLAVHHGSNDAWSLFDLDSPIGYDAGVLLGSTYLLSGGWQDIVFPLDTSSGILQPDAADKEMTLGLIPQASSSDTVYSYFEGAAAVRMRRPYLCITTTTLVGDYDKDLDVDAGDLAEFASFYGAGSIEADLDKNGTVSTLDLELFSHHFGRSISL